MKKDCDVHSIMNSFVTFCITYIQSNFYNSLHNNYNVYNKYNNMHTN